MVTTEKILMEQNKIYKFVNIEKAKSQMDKSKKSEILFYIVVTATIIYFGSHLIIMLLKNYV